jgi:hypothetical protein
VLHHIFISINPLIQAHNQDKNLKDIYEMLVLLIKNVHYKITIHYNSNEEQAVGVDFLPGVIGQQDV